ncbi:MAG: TonB C-terminal domain-containing protein [Deltaproteobacteria bacterium]|nr:TonB C-terminal domain-containing protein [Deltaproteobacteria bacterium]
MGSQPKRGRARRRPHGGYATALLLTIVMSVVVHMAFVPIVVTMLIRSMHEDDYHVVEFKGLARDLEASEIEEPEPEYDPDVDIPDRQVVDAPDPEWNETTEREKEAEYVSDKTVRVKKQSKSATRLTGAYEVGSAVAGPQGLQGAELLPGILAQPLEPGKDFEPAEEGTVLMGQSPMEYQTDPDKPAINLMPTFNSVAGAIKGSGIDSLQKVEDGPKTLLDTDEWQFAGFFNRVKNAVAQHWHPGPAYTFHDPTGRVYGYKDRETVIKVVLKCDGTLKHTYVKQPSGADFLDNVAVKAIKKAAPFTNPPDPLCDVEEQIIAFRFGFLVKVGDSSLIKVRKY